MFNHVAPYRYLLHNLYFSVADIANPDLFACGSRTWISLDIVRFYEEHCQPSSGFAWLACQKTVIEPTLLGAGGVDTICTGVCQTAVTAPPRVGCVVWSRYYHSLLPSLTVPHHTMYTITQCYPSPQCYHFSLLPSLTGTITHCYHYLLLLLLIVTITHC